MTNRLYLSLGFAAVAFFLAALWAFRDFVADDAFIVGRYALNAADGIGLVYNAGERVSALTSPLHALFLSAIALVSDDPVRLYRLVAPVVVLAGAAAAIGWARLSLRETAVFLCVALAPPMVALWTLGGLETPILHALLGLFGAGMVRVWRKGVAEPQDYALMAAVAGLAFLTRHDSVLVTLPPMLFVAFRNRRDPALWRSAAAAACIAAAWGIFATVYYGSIIPTSAHLKLSDETSNPGILSTVLVPNAFLVTGLVLALPFLRFAMPEDPLRRALARGGVVATALWFGYAANVSAEHMMFGYRFYVPYLALGGILLAPQAARLPLVVPVLMLAVQGAVGWRMMTVGANVVPTSLLPGSSLAYEWSNWPPDEYARFMRALEASADEVAAHWQGEGKEGTPKIFLWSGGAGYWLRDFYVYETLVSYRERCQEFRRPALLASHYVQFLPLGFESGHGTFLANRDDMGEAPVRIEATSLARFGDARLHYLYGPDPVGHSLPPRVDLPC